MAGSAAAQSPFFASRVEQHDHKGEEHHDGAGVDDNLRSGQELSAKQEVKHGQRSHDHNQREGTADGMALKQEVDGSSKAESGKDDKENQVHRSVLDERGPQKSRPVEGRHWEQDFELRKPLPIVLERASVTPR